MGAERGLLWAAAMETESWDVWLRYGSCADDTSPTGSARNARTLSSWQRRTCRLVFMVSCDPVPPPQCSWFSIIHKVRRNVGYLAYPRAMKPPKPLCHTSHHPGAHVAQSPRRNVTIMSSSQKPSEARCRSRPCRCGSPHSVSSRRMRCVGRHPLLDLWDSAPTSFTLSQP